MTATTDKTQTEVATADGKPKLGHCRSYSVPDVADLTVRGLAECTCGVRYSVGGGCPDAERAGIPTTWVEAS